MIITNNNQNKTMDPFKLLPFTSFPYPIQTFQNMNLNKVFIRLEEKFGEITFVFHCVLSVSDGTLILPTGIKQSTVVGRNPYRLFGILLYFIEDEPLKVNSYSVREKSACLIPPTSTVEIEIKSTELDIAIYAIYRKVSLFSPCLLPNTLGTQALQVVQTSLKPYLPEVLTSLIVLYIGLPYKNHPVVDLITASEEKSIVGECKILSIISGSNNSKNIPLSRIHINGYAFHNLPDYLDVKIHLVFLEVIAGQVKIFDGSFIEWNIPMPSITYITHKVRNKISNAIRNEGTRQHKSIPLALIVVSVRSIL